LETSVVVSAIHSFCSVATADEAYDAIESIAYSGGIQCLDDILPNLGARERLLVTAGAGVNESGDYEDHTSASLLLSMSRQQPVDSNVRKAVCKKLVVTGYLGVVQEAFEVLNDPSDNPTAESFRSNASATVSLAGWAERLPDYSIAVNRPKALNDVRLYRAVVETSASAGLITAAERTRMLGDCDRVERWLEENESLVVLSRERHRRLYQQRLLGIPRGNINDPDGFTTGGKGFLGGTLVPTDK
jgi:hypothetical protein